MVLQHVSNVKRTRTELFQAYPCVGLVLWVQHHRQAVHSVCVKRGTRLMLQFAKNAWLVHSSTSWELLLAFLAQQVRMERFRELTTWHCASTVLQANSPRQVRLNVQAVKKMHIPQRRRQCASAI